jgi:hypothetical protein
LFSVPFCVFVLFFSSCVVFVIGICAVWACTLISSSYYYYYYYHHHHHHRRHHHCILEWYNLVTIFSGSFKIALMYM